MPIAPVAMKIAGKLCSMRCAKSVEVMSYGWFDRWVARRLAVAKAKVFVGYESSTPQSFRVAKAAGMTAVLDAASIHHHAQDRLHGYAESARLHRSICDVKDEEIALADVILTPSEISLESYLEAGVPPAKLKMIPLGADLSVFSPSNIARPHSPFRFLFAGAQIYRKGIDQLLKAFSSVRSELGDTELWLAGGSGDASHLVQSYGGPGLNVKGPITQQQLAQIYHEVDCLVLPSRNDSYGMVVAEALASGVPVIITEMVGTRTFIEEDRNGWVLPTGDLESLREKMRWCAMNRDDVRAMRLRAAETARALGWHAYHARIAEFFRTLGA